MNILVKNETITPHRISLCILLHEILISTQIPHAVLIKALKFLTTQIIFEKQELSFPELLAALHQLDQPDYRLSDRIQSSLDSITNYSDLLSLFLVKLEELKNDGDSPSRLLQQGGALFAFIIKNFITFTRMGFDDLTRLEKRLQAYKANTSSCKESSASSIASNLSSLFTTVPYPELLSKVEALTGGDKHIILSHIDAAYGKSSAVDHAHRYFDSVLDKYMPTKTTKERGLVVVHSSTHFASMHRVKVELEVGHLDVAVHLLVETIKRALSENDNSAILESTLLFMQIAALIGNFRQEERIGVKAVLHAIQMGSTIGLIKSCLSYLNLELVYDLPFSEQIMKAIQPTPLPKKMNTIHKRLLTYSASVKPSMNLASHTIIEAIKDQKFSEYLPKLLEIKTLLWSERSPWLSDCHAKLLKEIDGDSISKYPDCNFFLKNVRSMAIHNKAIALQWLDAVDQACPIKEPTEWTFTVCYLNAVWGTHAGTFREAEYFEEQAYKHIKPLSAPESGILIELAKGERLAYQKDYAGAYKVLSDVISTCKSRQLAQEACRGVFLLSTLLTEVQEYVRAYYLLKEELKEQRGDAYLLLQIRMSEVMIDIYPLSSACLDNLACIEQPMVMSRSLYLWGKFHLVKAKGLVAISQMLGADLTGKVLTKALDHLNVAVGHFKDLGFVWDLRECYYLMARVYDTRQLVPLRDEAAAAFCKCNQTLNLAQKRCVAMEAGSLALQEYGVY